MRQTVNKLPQRIYYLQVGDEEWYGPYSSLEGLDRRIHEYRKWQSRAFSRLESRWNDPVIIQMDVGEPEVRGSEQEQP